MVSVHIRLILAMAVSFLVLSTVVPAYGASGPFLTTGMTQSGIKEANIGGNKGVLVNYTNTYSSSFGAFIYLDLTNAAGQTVYWNVGYCGFSAGQKVQCYVLISATVPSGTYTAWAFATTNSTVPVSVTSSVSVTV